jgi:putative colanic acid biosynthesis acetyltransferase WcaF
MSSMPQGVRLDRYDQSHYERGRPAWVVVLWDLVQQVLIHTSPHPCYGWRSFWYRRFGADIGHDVRIRKSVRCNYPWNLAIGDHAWIGDEATLYTLGRIEIGAHAVVSQQAYLCTGSHDHHDPAFGLIVKPISIGQSAWIALGVLVMPGVRIGAGSLIAARAVVTKDTLPWMVYRGSPATVAGRRELREAVA